MGGDDHRAGSGRTAQLQLNLSLLRKQLLPRSKYTCSTVESCTKSGQNRGGAYTCTWDHDISVSRPLSTDECHMGAQLLHFIRLFDDYNLKKQQSKT